MLQVMEAVSHVAVDAGHEAERGADLDLGTGNTGQSHVHGPIHVTENGGIQYYCNLLLS